MTNQSWAVFCGCHSVKKVLLMNLMGKKWTDLHIVQLLIFVTYFKHTLQLERNERGVLIKGQLDAEFYHMVFLHIKLNNKVKSLLSQSN